MSNELLSIWWLLAAIVLPAFACLVVYLRARRMQRILTGLVEADGQALLFYDEHDRLAFASSGLVVFDRRALRPIRKLAKRPATDKTLTGEIVIDSNKYRYRAKLLAYKPETCGTLMHLEYVGPAGSRA